MTRLRSAEREYERSRQTIDKLLVEIGEGLDAHRPRLRERLTWGHVGDLNHYAEQLRDVADQLLHRGEYAKERG